MGLENKKALLYIYKIYSEKQQSQSLTEIPFFNLIRYQITMVWNILTRDDRCSLY